MPGTFELVIDEDRQAAVNLYRVIPCLERRIFTSEGEEKLLHSHFERLQVSATIDYARRLQKRLEHVTPEKRLLRGEKSHQPSAKAQRSQLRRIIARFREIEQVGDDRAFAEASESDNDLWKECTRSTQMTNTSVGTEPTGAGQANIPGSSLSKTENPESNEPAIPASGGLRNRFDPTSILPNSISDNNSASASILQENDVQAADLTGELLTLAKALKASSSRFATALAEDDVALDRAVAGLDKNESGLQRAGRSMGMLRKMSEGKGLWGRTMLYIWIGALWAVAVLLVFAGPKLRF